MPTTSPFKIGLGGPFVRKSSTIPCTARVMRWGFCRSAISSTRTPLRIRGINPIDVSGYAVATSLTHFPTDSPPFHPRLYAVPNAQSWPEFLTERLAGPPCCLTK